MTGDEAAEVLLSLADYAEHVGKTDRTVRRWLEAGRLPAARKIGREWSIPRDAYPLPVPDDVSGGHDADMSTGRPSAGVALRGREIAPAPVAVPALWFTVDELAEVWAPHVPARAIRRMIRDGKLEAVRGRRGAWVIPAGEVRRRAFGA